MSSKNALSDMVTALERGHLHNWLMITVDDDGADRRRTPATTQPESVLSGRRNEDL